MAGIDSIVDRLEAWFTGPQWALWLLGVFNTLNSVFESMLGFVSRLVNAAKTVIGPQLYYCFYGYPIPLPILYFEASASSSAQYEWIYDAVSKYFFVPEEGVAAAKGKRGVTLPILSLEIVEGDDVLYDLTDFVEGVRVFHGAEAAVPSVAHLLGAWSLSSGIVLDMERDFKVRVMTTDADTLEADAFNILGLHRVLAAQNEVADVAETDAAVADAAATDAAVADAAVADAAATDAAVTQPALLEGTDDEDIPPPPPPPGPEEGGETKKDV